MHSPPAKRTTAVKIHVPSPPSPATSRPPAAAAAAASSPLASISARQLLGIEDVVLASPTGLPSSPSSPSAPSRELVVIANTAGSTVVTSANAIVASAAAAAQKKQDQQQQQQQQQASVKSSFSPKGPVPVSARLTEALDMLPQRVPQTLPALSCWPARPTLARSVRDAAHSIVGEQHGAVLLAASKRPGVHAGTVVSLAAASALTKKRRKLRKRSSRRSVSARNDDGDDGPEWEAVDGDGNATEAEEEEEEDADALDSNGGQLHPSSPLTLTSSKPSMAVQLEKELRLRLRSKKSTFHERVAVVNDLLGKLGNLFPSYATVLHSTREVVAGFEKELQSSVAGVESNAVATVETFVATERSKLQLQLRDETEARVRLEAEVRCLKDVLAKRVRDRDADVKEAHRETVKLIRQAQDQVHLDEEVRRLRLHVGSLASENAKLKLLVHTYEKELAIEADISSGGGGQQRPYRRDLTEQVSPSFLAATAQEVERCRMQRELVDAASGTHSAFRLKIAHMQAEIDSLSEKLREAEAARAAVEAQAHERRFTRGVLPLPVFAALKRDGFCAPDEEFEASSTMPARRAELENVGRCYTPRANIPADVQYKLGISLLDRSRDITENLAVLAVDLHEELAELRKSNRKLHAAARWMVANEIDAIFDEEQERAEDEISYSSLSPDQLLGASTNQQRLHVMITRPPAAMTGIIATFAERDWPHIPHFLRTDTQLGVPHRSWGAHETVRFSVQVLNMLSQPHFIEQAKRLKDKFVIRPPPDTLQDRRRSALLPALDATTAAMVSGTAPVPIGYLMTVVLRHLAEELLLRQDENEAAGSGGIRNATNNNNNNNGGGDAASGFRTMSGTLADTLLMIGIGGLSSVIGPNQQAYQKRQVDGGSRAVSRTAVGRVAVNLAYNLFESLRSYQRSEPICRLLLRIIDGSQPLGIFDIFRRFVSSLHQEIIDMQVDTTVTAAAGAGATTASANGKAPSSASAGAAASEPQITWPLFAKCLAWRFSGAPLPSMGRLAVFHAAKTVEWLGLTFADKLPVRRMLSIDTLQLGDVIHEAKPSNKNGSNGNGSPTDAAEHDDDAASSAASSVKRHSVFAASGAVNNSKAAAVSPLAKALLHLALDAVQELWSITFAKLEPLVKQSTMVEGVSVINVGEALDAAKDVDAGFLSARENDFARSSYIARPMKPALVGGSSAPAAASSSSSSSPPRRGAQSGEDDPLDLPDSVNVSTALSFSAFWYVRDALLGAPKLDEAVHKPTGGSGQQQQQHSKPSTTEGGKKRRRAGGGATAASLAAAGPGGAGGAARRRRSSVVLPRAESTGDLASSPSFDSTTNLGSSQLAKSTSSGTAFLMEMLEDPGATAQTAAVGELDRKAYVEFHDLLARLRRVTPQLLAAHE